ncbi:MAG: hypothetical protein NTY33_01880 [Candidatus Moranbacteria bacterium]|nr:hypothetical protein [Candidatus Moranbacteria bacterium]
MLQKTSEKIIKYIEERGQATANELVDFLAISERAVFRQLANLIAEEKLTKIGRPPKVFYLIKEESAAKGDTIIFSESTKKIIEENFLTITPSGEKMMGVAGFIFWCKRTNQAPQKMAEIYEKTIAKYAPLKKDAFIDGMTKMKSTFADVHLDQLYYLDFYSLEIFGKTKLGQLLLYAKQSQDKNLMKELFFDIKPKIDRLIKEHNIDGVGFIPPTVKRKVQLMKELEKMLHPNIRKISIVKATNEIAVPQKTLSRLDDRVENARKTIIVNDSGQYDNILLIDDAVGSGATLNETAAQIRKRKLCNGKIIGLAITGSLKGFDVISEI